MPYRVYRDRVSPMWVLAPDATAYEADAFKRYNLRHWRTTVAFLVVCPLAIIGMVLLQALVPVVGGVRIRSGAVTIVVLATVALLAAYYQVRFRPFRELRRMSKCKRVIRLRTRRAQVFWNDASKRIDAVEVRSRQAGLRNQLFETIREMEILRRKIERGDENWADADIADAAITYDRLRKEMLELIEG